MSQAISSSCSSALSSIYNVMLDKIQAAISATCPPGFSKEVDEAAWRARRDALAAVEQLRGNDENAIQIEMLLLWSGARQVATRGMDS